jgi:hypothetical protein
MRARKGARRHGGRRRLRDAEEHTDLKELHTTRPRVVREYLRFKKIADDGGPDATEMGSTLSHLSSISIRSVIREFTEADLMNGLSSTRWGGFFGADASFRYRGQRNG